MIIRKWIMKYSKLVSKFVGTLNPAYRHIYKVNETTIKCKGVQEWSWEIIDEETLFRVTSHLLGSRTVEDAIVLQEIMKIATKKKPSVVTLLLKHVMYMYVRILCRMAHRTV